MAFFQSQQLGIALFDSFLRVISLVTDSNMVRIY